MEKGDVNLGRRSSFGSRLGAYRNRQIRRVIKFGWKNNARSNTTPVTNPERNSVVAGLIIASLFISGLICFLSTVAR